MSNVKKVIQYDLCMQCGICEPFCPNNAISIETKNFTRNVYVDLNKCTNCGLCYKICPGKSITPKNDVLDNGIIKTLLLQSSESANNKYIASGGFVTAFLSFLLDNRYVDGVLCATSKGYELAKSIVIGNPDDICYASGSFYYRVPLNNGLHFILNNPGRYAVVGLPCQIKGIRNISKINEKLNERIFITIGLLCGYMLGETALEYLVKKININDISKINKISYRSKLKYENDAFLIETESEDFFISNRNWNYLTRYFSPKRCLMCNEMTNELADISCGDAHRLATGKSLVLIRKSFAEKLVSEAKKRNYFEYEVIPNDSYWFSQKPILFYKCTTIKARLFWLKLFNKEMPEFEKSDFIKSSLSQYIGSFLFILNCYLTKSRFIRNVIINYIPDYLLKKYAKLITTLLTRRVKKSIFEKRLL